MAKKLSESANADAKLPNGEVLKSVISRMNGAKAKMDEARGDLGSIIKNAEDSHNIHRAALKLVAKLEKMDSAKLSDWLAHFDHYRQVRGLDEMAGPNMFDAADEDEDEFDAAAPEPEPDPVKENVTALRRGIKKKPESPAAQAIEGWA